MAGDDDVLIKVATDVAAAVASLGTLLEQFKNIGETLKAVDTSAEGTSSTMEQMAEAIVSAIGSIAPALESISENLTLLSGSVTTALDQTVVAGDAVAQTMTGMTEATGAAAQQLGMFSESGTEALGTTNESAKTLSETFAEKLAPSVDDVEALSGPLFDTLEDGADTLKDAARAAEKTGDEIADLGGAFKEGDAAQQSFFDHVEDGVAQTFKLSEAVNNLRAKREEEQQSVEALTQSEKALIEELLAGGAAYKEVAEAANLSVDAVKLVVEQQEAARKAFEESQQPTQGFFETLFSGFTDSGAAAVTWGVLTADALKKVGQGIIDAAKALPNFLQGMADLGDGLQTMANRLGMTAAEVRELQFISELSGVSTNIMAKAMQTLSVQLLDTSSKASNAVQAIGLIPAELAKMPKSEALAKIVETINALPPGLDKGAQMIEIFGTKASQMTGLLKEDLGGIHETFVNLVDPEVYNKIGKLGDDWNDNIATMKLGMEGFKVSVASRMITPLQEFLKWLGKLNPELLTFAEYIGSASDEIVTFGASIVTMAGGAGKDLGSIFTLFKKGTASVKDFGKSAMDSGNQLRQASVMADGFGGVLKNLGTGFSNVGSSLTNFIKAIPMVVGGLMKMTWAVVQNTVALLLNPWVLAAAAITALGVVLYNMVGGWEGMTKAFNATMEALEPVITLFQDLFTIVWDLHNDVLRELWKSIKTGIGWFVKLFTGVHEGTEQFGGLIDAVIAFIKWIKEIPIVGMIVKEITKNFTAFYDRIMETWKWAKAFFAWLGNTVHSEAQRIRGENAAIQKSTLQTTEAQTKAEEDHRSALQKRMDTIAKATAISKALTKQQQAEIVAMDKAGDSAEDIAKLVQSGMKGAENDTKLATLAVETFLKSVEAAKNAAGKDPFQKMMKSAKELGVSLAKATAQGVPFLAVVSQYGAKALEIYNQAALDKALDKIPESLTKVALAFKDESIKDKLLKASRAATELSVSLKEKMSEAMRSASESLRAMSDEMTLGMLTGNAQRMAQMDMEDRRFEEALAKRAEAADRARSAELRAIEINAQKQLATVHEQETDPAARDQRVAEIEADKQQRIEAANAIATVTQEGLAKEQALRVEYNQYRRDQENATTKDYEVNAAKRGVATQQQAAEALKIEQQKLDLMKNLLSDETAFAVEEQERKIALMKDGIEQDAKARGLVTLKARQVEVAQEEKALAAMEKDRKNYYEWEIEAKRRNVAMMKNEVEKEAKALGLVTKADLEETKRREQEKYAFMVKYSKDFTTDQKTEQKKRMQDAEDAANSTLQAWKKAFAGAAQAAGALGEAFSALGEAANSPALKNIGKGLDFAEEMLGAVAGLLEVKDTLGAVIAVAKIAAVAIKGLWDAFSTSSGEKAQKDIKRNFDNAYGKALEVTEEFGDEIAKTAEEMFSGNRFAAQIYKLNDIIAEAGGLSEKNFGSMADSLGEVFTMLEEGTYTSQQATEALDNSFGLFSKHVIESGKVASAGFVKLLQNQEKYGTKSKEIMAFVSGQTSRLGTALNTMLGPYAKLADLTDQLGKTKDTAEIAKLTEEINKVKGSLGDTTTAMGRFERLAVAGFNAAIKSGAGYVEAMQSMGPALDTIVRAHQALGTTAGPAIEELLRFREVANANKELVESAGSLNEVMLALSNIGGLNAETFADLQAQGLETFSSLQAAGFTEQQSLQQMKGFLEQVRTAHTELGLPIDENTQKLIDQAEQQGVLKAEQMSTNDIMLEGLGAIIKALGGDLPESFQKAAKAGVASANTIADAMSQKAGKSVEQVDKGLRETGWAGYAGKAVTAAKISEDALKGTKGSISAVDLALRETEWDAWAREAVDAAGKAKSAMDAVALGESPGGIREIATRLRMAMAAAKEWERASVTSAQSVKDAMETSVSGAVSRSVMASASVMGSGGGGGGITIEEGAVVIDRPILKDSAAMQELTLEIAKKLKGVLNPRGAW